MATLTAGVPARPRRAWRLPRLDARVTIGLVLIAVSVLGGLRLLAAADHTVAVWAASRDLPAEHVLGPDDVRVARVHASPEVLGRLVRSESSLAGRVLRFPVERGGLLAASSLGRNPRSGREITVPVAPEHALGGAVHRGDRVDLLASFGKGTDDARTLTVAQNAEVVDVVRGSGLFGQHEGTLSALTLSVPADDTVFVAFAARNGELDVVRATGRVPSSRTRFDRSELP